MELEQNMNFKTTIFEQTTFSKINSINFFVPGLSFFLNAKFWLNHGKQRDKQTNRGSLNRESYKQTEKVKTERQTNQQRKRIQREQIDRQTEVYC